MVKHVCRQGKSKMHKRERKGREVTLFKKIALTIFAKSTWDTYEKTDKKEQSSTYAFFIL